MREEFTANRFATLRAGLDFARLRGIEIGPLDHPIVTKADGDVTYVDVEDAEALRKRHGAGLPDPAKIVTVDAIWGERSLAECVGGAVFDYVIASHVAEHVPDLITWLGEVRNVLRPEGELRLAMPDRRFSFDVLRDETRIVDLLTNYVLRARRPTVANVLDFRLHYAPDMSGHDRFRHGTLPPALAPEIDLHRALDSAGWARDLPDRYFDVHCWVFQPRSFARCMARLAAEGLVRFRCARLIDPSMPLLEFYAFLVPCDDTAVAAASWREAGAAAADPLPGSAEARAVSPADELAMLRQSTSWRLTAPLRRLKTLLS